jgi:hypothetical protein
MSTTHLSGQGATASMLFTPPTSLLTPPTSSTSSCTVSPTEQPGVSAEEGEYASLEQTVTSREWNLDHSPLFSEVTFDDYLLDLDDVEIQ